MDRSSPARLGISTRSASSPIGRVAGEMNRGRRRLASFVSTRLRRTRTRHNPERGVSPVSVSASSSSSSLPEEDRPDHQVLWDVVPSSDDEEQEEAVYPLAMKDSTTLTMPPSRPHGGREWSDKDKNRMTGLSAGDEATSDRLDVGCHGQEDLYQQLNSLQLAKNEADQAWRRENARLRDQLQAALAREDVLSQRLQVCEEQLSLLDQATHRHANHAQDGKSFSPARSLEKKLGSPMNRPVTEPTTPLVPKLGSVKSTASSSSLPSPRERILLQLLIQVVGKDRIRALLAQSSGATTTPTQMRRRLVKQARTAMVPTPSLAVPVPAPVPPPAPSSFSSRKYEMSTEM